MTLSDRRALALRCDPEGIVERLLVDEIGASQYVGLGQSFLNAIDPSSKDEVRNLLSTAMREFAVLDREIRLRGSDAGPAAILHVAGLAMPANRILVVGARSFSAAATLLSDLLPNNPPTADALTASFRAWCQWTSGRPTQEHELYNELSRINNELINARRELTKRNAELARVDAEKNQFLGMVVHDLRNPLTVIQTYSEFLSELQGKIIGRRELQFINAIDRSSEFILGLINDLLDISKIEADQLVLNKRPTNLDALIEHNLSLNRVLAERKHVRLDYKSMAKFSNILLDARKIDQVLNNLVDNAIKVSPPQGTIAVQLSREDDSALLRVTDQGPGIPADELQVIFQPFRQGHLGTTKEGKSAGLGLAIANSIVRGHGGRLWAESIPPNGASFFVQLPVSGTLT
ncbi:MAG: sensor histidine kinase [Alphaproteobacteria bacterium]